jgi:hypothetical protein
MTRLVCNASLLAVWGLAAVSGFGQSSSSSAPQPAQSTSSEPSRATASAQDPASVTPEAKKKKVWTNDDVSGLSGPVSVVGNSKNASKPVSGGDGTADGQYIANTKKELAKLQAQLDDTNKQLTALKDFSQGKAPEPAGYQIGKGYGRIPVDQQIASLEQKLRELQEKIDALFDEARKKGVLPGQLR